MTKFIQLGERKNGRIVKNEQWSLDKFGELFGFDASAIPTLSTFDKLFKTKKYIKAIEQKAFNAGVKSVLYDMEILIEWDIMGKGSGTRIKKRGK